MAAHRSRRFWIVGTGLLVAGCQTGTPGGPAVSGTATDPCFWRLEAICGHLFDYTNRHGELPPSLEALRAVKPAGSPPLESPESGEPYVYHASSLEMPGRPGRLLIHSPTRARATVRGRPSRWTVLVSGLGADEPIIAQVILVPEREVEAALATGSE